MTEQATPLDAKKVLLGLLQLRYKKQPIVTDGKDIALLNSIIRDALAANGARTRNVYLNTSLENVAHAADHPRDRGDVEYKALGPVDVTLLPTHKLPAVTQGACPGVEGILAETQEGFVLLPDGEGLIMVIFPKADTEA